MAIVDHVKEKARSNVKTIVLPEGDEPRTLQAAAIIAKDRLARPVLLGDPEKIASVARETGADIGGIEIIDPLASPKAAEYAARSFIVGKTVTVIPVIGDERSSYAATVLGIDKEARLLVRLNDGSERALSSGEISIKIQ